MQMIELKTAVLLGVAFRMGAMLADVAEYEQQKIYDFGKYLGLAFQIQDDYMDIYSDEKVFGKQHGSDIKSNKKTYLLLKALELSDRQTAQTLIEYFNAQLQPEEKVRLITEIYQSLGLKQKVEADIVAMYSKAKDVLSSIQGLTGEGRERLSSLADYLIRRQR
jgi:geranylgeranyl diphosphate synthase type II